MVSYSEKSAKNLKGGDSSLEEQEIKEGDLEQDFIFIYPCKPGAGTRADSLFFEKIP